MAKSESRMPAPETASDSRVVGGAAVFKGTRVPLRTLDDYVQAGHSLDSFLDDFPSVRREQASPP